MTIRSAIVVKTRAHKLNTYTRRQRGNGYLIIIHNSFGIPDFTLAASPRRRITAISGLQMIHPLIAWRGIAAHPRRAYHNQNSARSLIIRLGRPRLSCRRCKIPRRGRASHHPRARARNRKRRTMPTAVLLLRRFFLPPTPFHPTLQKGRPNSFIKTTINHRVDGFSRHRAGRKKFRASAGRRGYFSHGESVTRRCSRSETLPNKLPISVLEYVYW